MKRGKNSGHERLRSKFAAPHLAVVYEEQLLLTVILEAGQQWLFAISSHPSLIGLRTNKQVNLIILDSSKKARKDC